MTHAMTLRLSAEMHESVRREAFERRVPMSTIIQDAIDHRTVSGVIGCDVCGKPHTHISTPGGFRFCDEHYRPTTKGGAS